VITLKHFGWKVLMFDPRKTPSPLAITLAWILVMIPLSWGVYQSVVKSLPLFESTARP
jgi:hypothetical protein